jgi:hypothetical protein
MWFACSDLYWQVPDNGQYREGLPFRKDRKMRKSAGLMIAAIAWTGSMLGAGWGISRRAQKLIWS